MTKCDDNKINLLHLVQTLGVGGAETLLLETIPALGMAHYKHYVYYFGSDGPIRGKIENLGISVVSGPRRSRIKHPIKFAYSLLRLGKHLNRFIKEHRIQIIQSHLGHANHLGVAIGKLSGIPVFPTFHNTMEFAFRRSRWDIRMYMAKLMNDIIYMLAGKIVAVSDEVKDFLKKRFRLRDSKIIVLKNGIIFEDSVHPPIDIAQEFPDSSNKLKLIAVGRLTYQKAFEILVKAVAELVKCGQKDLFLMIAGDGEERMRLDTLIHDLRIGNYVKLLGIRHDIKGLMKASDLFVIPSRFEGLSIAMIEAMACGLPVIASDAPGLRDHIKERQNGLLFPVENHKALAECIRLLVNDQKLRIKLSLGAKKSFEIEYNMRNNIKSLDFLFREHAMIR